MENRSKKWFILFAGPLIATFALVVLVPFFMGIYYSFFQWDGVRTNPMVFVGLDNYIASFSDQAFRDSVWVTIKFTVIAVISVNLVGLSLALLVTTKLRTVNAARAMFFMPNLIGGLILGYIWQFIFTDGFRVVGESTGFDTVFKNWLLDPNLALMAIVVVFTWQMAGYIMIIYIAGIQGIPGETIEASKIDGANAWQRLRYVIVPLLMPSFTICLFLALSNGFNIYTVNLSLTNGGPYGSTELFALHIYDEIFGSSKYGYGQAKAVMFFLLISAITLTQVYFSKKKEVEM